MNTYLLLAIVSYLLGSIPVGLLLAQSYGNKNISKQGSKNIGTTNAYRVAGKYIGIGTLIADIFKGFIAIQLAQTLFPVDNTLALVITGFFAVVGHVFPVWLRFHGGKGVATSFAVITSIDPALGSITLVTFLIMFFSFKIVSIASLTAVLATTVVSAFMVEGEIAYLVIILSLIIFYRHKENVLRILEGKEKKL